MSRTLKHPIPEKQPPSSRQTGAAALLTLLMLLLVTSGVLLDRLNVAASVPNIRSAETATSLAEAKAALIGWAVTHPQTPGMLPYPDRNALAPSFDPALDPDAYDGFADCAAVGGLAGNPALLLGRLPWRGEDNVSSTNCIATWPMGAPARDAGGEPLWYAVSANLLGNSSVPLNSGLLDNPTPAFPWITVRDRNGAVISNQVAAVIMAPGRALSAVPRVGAGPIDQTGRNAVAPAAVQFLDGVNVGGTVFANADTDGCKDDDIGCIVGPPGEDFIMSPDSRLTADDSDNFNDQLVFITVEELLRATEKRVLGEFSVMLESYRGTHGRYPWLSPFRPPPPTATSVGLLTAPAGTTILVDNEGLFQTKGVAPGDLIRNPNTGDEATIVVAGASETQLTFTDPTLPDPIPIASGDSYVVVYNRTAGATSSDIQLVDVTMDFVAAGVRPGDQIQKTPTTPSGGAVVVSVVNANTLEIRAFESFAGSNYQIAPAAFDAVIGTREGNIPFTNATESYTFATGFTVSPWTNGTAPAGPWVDVLTTTYPSIDWHNNNDTRTEAAVLAALVRPNDAPPLVVLPQNGVCTWSGATGRVKCRGFAEVDIDLTNTDTTPTGPYYPYIPYTGILYSPGEKDSLLGIHGQPGIGGSHWEDGWLPTGEDIGSDSWITVVRRRFTFDLDYAGTATTVSVNGVKTRNVIGLPLTGLDYMTITVEDSVEFPDLAWRVIASATLNATAGTNASVNTNSIYYDPRDDDELPAWFTVNEWSTYIYAAFAEDVVSGGDGDCTTPLLPAPPSCLTLNVAGNPDPRDIQALVISSGVPLNAQDRAIGDCDGDGILNSANDSFLCAYFDSDDTTAYDIPTEMLRHGGNIASITVDTYARDNYSNIYNDQIRVFDLAPP